MKFKLAVPRNILTAHQINLVEGVLAKGLLGVVASHFPNWKERSDAGDISGGEIILQDTDTTQPIHGLKLGIHLTISLVSYRPDRNFDGLAHSVIKLIKGTSDDHGVLFMAEVNVFVQMTLNQMVRKDETTNAYIPADGGECLLEYSG